MKISRRLEFLATLIIKGQNIADIGSDHGQLALYLLENDLVPQVIVTEVALGPFRKLSKIVAASIWSEQVQVRLGNGLLVLAPGEVSTVVMAGMGGDTMAAIMSVDWLKASSYARFVFQPMSKPEVLRQRLAEQGWPILEEHIIDQESRFYVAMVCKPGFKPYELSDLEKDIGPCILKDNSSIQRIFLQNMLQKYSHINDGLQRAQGIEQGKMRQECTRKIAELEEILHAGNA